MEKQLKILTNQMTRENYSGIVLFLAYWLSFSEAADRGH